MAEFTFEPSRGTPPPVGTGRTTDWATSTDRSAPQIRSARLADLDQLTEVLASSFYDRTGWLGWTYPLMKLGIQEDMKQRLKGDPFRYACLAAVAPIRPAPIPDPAPQETLVGTVELTYRQAWPWQDLQPRYAYISNLAVAQGWRQRGFAAQLLLACEALAMTWQIHHLYLHVMEDNPTAQRLYHRAGFQLAEREDSVAAWLGWQSRRLLLYKALPVPAQGNPV